MIKGIVILSDGRRIILSDKMTKSTKNLLRLINHPFIKELDDKSKGKRKEDTATADNTDS